MEAVLTMYKSVWITSAGVSAMTSFINFIIFILSVTKDERNEYQKETKSQIMKDLHDRCKVKDIAETRKMVKEK